MALPVGREGSGDTTERSVVSPGGPGGVRRVWEALLKGQ